MSGTAGRLPKFSGPPPIRTAVGREADIQHDTGRVIVVEQVVLDDAVLEAVEVQCRPAAAAIYAGQQMDVFVDAGK